VREQWPWLQPYVRPHHHLLEIGPGDGALARWACAHVQQVSTVDVSHTMLSAALREPVPAQLSARVFDGVHLPLDSGEVDVAFSHQLMEHLHPDDAAAQLTDIARVLRPGGRYVCVTPHRYSGPHDISAHFSNTPLGLHLREYTGQELCALMREAGFERADVMVRVHGRLLHLPDALLHLMERQLAQLSAGESRRQRMRHKPYAWLSTLCVVGQMPHRPPSLMASRGH
jgi:SAM-dependent methyltransferase